MTGLDMPKLGFGTYGRTGDAGVEAMLTALATGYRHLDTAQSYGTEPQVGAALKQAGLPRDEVFVTTKIRPENFGPGKLIPSLEESIGRLGTEPDLTLIHWPSPHGEIEPEVYLEQLAEARSRGLTRLAGVSNFTIALLQRAQSVLGEVATNQVELNPLFRNRRLADHCDAAGIVVTCYQPIAHGRLGDAPALVRIAETRGASPEQVALAWELGRGYAAIPTSSKAERIRANFAALDIALTEAEMAEIERLDQAPRSIDPAGAPAWD